MGKRKNIINQCISLIAIFILCVIYTVIINGSFKTESFIQIMSLLTSYVYISSLIFIFNTDKEIISTLYQYFSIGFAGVGLLSISYIMIVKNGLNEFQTLSKIGRAYHVFNFFEIGVFLFAFLFYNKNIKFSIVAFGTVAITFLTAHLGLKSNLPFIVALETLGSTSYKSMLHLTVIGLYVFILIIIYNKKRGISNEILIYFKMYIFLRIGMQSFIFLTQDMQGELKMLIQHLFRFIGNYCIFKVMIIEALSSPNKGLYTKLLVKSEDLEKTKEELERKTREEEMKNEILANISHEFKTPVNVIFSAIQMQDLNRIKGNTTEIYKFNLIIKQNCYRLIRLINNFIDSSKFVQHDFTPNFKYENCVEVVESVTMSVLSFAESRSIEVIFDTDQEAVCVYIDKQLIERVILNLLSNSIKYNKINGNIFVTIKTSSDNTVIIEVNDTGIGVPKEKQKLIFNRFERVDKSLAREKEGSGLGLHIVNEIVKLHQGEILLDSILGIGTSIRILLPIKDKKYLELRESSKEINHTKNESELDCKVELELSDIYC